MTDPTPAAPRAVTLDIDGVGIYAEWRREPVPGRPVLVFLHDGLGSIENWRAFPDMLADALDLGAFAYDRFGYGRSDGCDNWPESFIADAARRLPRILDAAGITEYILVGHSDGATVALSHAAIAPAGLRAVVSVSAHVKRDPWAYRGVIEFGETARGGELPAWLDRFHGARGAQVLTAWTGYWKRTLDAGWDISASLKGITAPLLAAQGSDDEWAHPLQLDTIADAVRHAETRMLDGRGHFPHLENPVELVDLVARFLRRAGFGDRASDIQ
jgi:pimeloyl-ACP methyl ester carboxylesterase